MKNTKYVQLIFVPNSWVNEDRVKENRNLSQKNITNKNKHFRICEMLFKAWLEKKMGHLKYELERNVLKINH